MARTDRTAAISRSERPRAVKIHELFLGYACDEKCLFCSQETAWRRQPAVAFADVARDVYLAFQRGCRILALNGGEPTLHKDILKIVALARKAGYEEVHIQTNGLRLAEPAFAASMADAGLTLARFSIHGHSDALHDAQVKVPGALRRARAAIEGLRVKGVSVGINTVVNQANAAALPAFYAHFLDDVGLTDFGLIFPLYEGDMAVNEDAMRVRLAEAAPHIRAAFEVFRTRGAEPPMLLNFPPCALPGYEGRLLRWSDRGAALYDAARGTVIDPGRYELRQPDGRSKGLDEASREGKVKLPGCARCVYDDRCLGYERKYVSRFGDAEFVPLAAVPEPFDARWVVDRSAWRRVLPAGETA